MENIYWPAIWFMFAVVACPFLSRKMMVNCGLAGVTGIAVIVLKWQERNGALEPTLISLAMVLSGLVTCYVLTRRRAVQ